MERYADEQIKDETVKAFIMSLHDNPFDPVTRAVFADYLEENGDMDRAE